MGGVWSIALQSSALSRRFARTALADRGNIAALLLSPLGLIAVAASVGAGQNFAISVLLILALFFGGSCSSRELVRERDIFKRERLYGLSHSAWVLSKALVLTVPVLLQAAGMIEMGRLCGIFSGSAWALWAATALAGLIGMSEGLFISALSGSVDISQGALFLFITLQLLFSGVVGSPPETAMSELLQQSQVASAARKAAFLANPAYWALDAMHRGCLTGGEMPINPPADPESLGQEVALEKHLAGMPAAIQAVETAQIQELQAADAGGKGVGYHARRKELRADAERKLKALSSVGELLRVDVGQLERSHRVHFISGSSLDDDCWILVMFVVVFILLTITVLAMQEAWRRTG
ncbi:MAG: ABC transporter permease [Candidatus Wallbacteria bacterium]|nr:ABC transporter permease [Candidatus Wallbacteria bacterium]